MEAGNIIKHFWTHDVIYTGKIYMGSVKKTLVHITCTLAEKSKIVYQQGQNLKCHPMQILGVTSWVYSFRKSALYSVGLKVFFGLMAIICLYIYYVQTVNALGRQCSYVHVVNCTFLG